MPVQFFQQKLPPSSSCCWSSVVLVKCCCWSRAILPFAEASSEVQYNLLCQLASVLQLKMCACPTSGSHEAIYSHIFYFAHYSICEIWRCGFFSPLQMHACCVFAKTNSGGDCPPPLSVPLSSLNCHPTAPHNHRINLSHVCTPVCVHS